VAVRPQTWLALGQKREPLLLLGEGERHCRIEAALRERLTMTSADCRTRSATLSGSWPGLD